MMTAMSSAMSMPRRTSRRLSDFSDIAYLTVAFNGFSLTEKQKQLIKIGYKKWSESTTVTVGEWVYQYIFHKFPSVKGKFAKDEKSLAENQRRITDIIEMAVESVDSLDDSLGSFLVSYSSENGFLGESEGFDRGYWEIVSEALCQLSRHFPVKSHKSDTVLAWRIVILFVINKIEYGFNLDEKLTDHSG
uniref:GLOBIN domain-containing protein n=1 Tax=Syphacia muris TaxID=451379 RepID=A0A0N5AH18_9BILA